MYRVRQQQALYMYHVKYYRQVPSSDCTALACPQTVTPSCVRAPPPLPRHFVACRGLHRARLRSGAYPPFGHQRPCMIAGKGGVFEKKGSGNARRRRCLSLDGSENTPGKGGVSAKTKAVEASKGGVSAHRGSGSARQRPCLSTQRQWRMQGTGGAGGVSTPKTVEIARHNCTAQKRQLTHTLRVWRCLGRQRQRRVHGSGECTAHRVHGVGRSSPGPPHAQGFGLPSESLPQVLAWYSRYPNTLHGAAPPLLKASREYLS